MRKVWGSCWVAGLLALGCGPAGETAEDTEGDTEATGTGSSSGGADPTMASATNPNPTMNTASNSGASADDTASGPDPDSTGPGGDSGSGTAGDDTGCPPGELDCPCDLGSTCNGELMCVDGTCVAQPACAQPEGEPNDDEASAIDLGQLDCGAEPIVQAGALDGVDLDWYTTVPNDGVVCFSSPTAAAVAADATDLTVCIYAQCNMGNTSVGCGFGMGAGMPDTSPDGAEGCCNTGSVDLDSVTCQSFDQSYVAWVRVSAAQDQCVDYELTLEY